MTNNTTPQPDDSVNSQASAEQDRATRLNEHLYKNFGERFGQPKQEWLQEVSEIQDEMRAGKLSR